MSWRILLEYTNIVDTLLAARRRTFSLEYKYCSWLCVDPLYKDHRPNLDIIIVSRKQYNVAKEGAEDYESVGAGLAQKTPDPSSTDLC